MKNAAEKIVLSPETGTAVAGRFRMLGARASRLRRFLAETSGAIMPMTAIFLPLVAMTSVFSVEYAKAVSDKESVRKAADAAVLMGARSMAQAVAKGSGDSEAEMRRNAIRVAQDAFGNATIDLNLDGTESFDVDYTIKDKAVDGELTFVGSHGTLFKNFSGGAFRLSVDTEASVPIRQRVDIHFVMDNSPSMNIGASAADQQIMIDNAGCAFACHRNGYDPSIYPDNLRAQGATLRFDVLKDAVSSAVELLEEIPSHEVDIHVAAHTFSNNLLTPIELSNDLDTVRTEIMSLDTIDAALGAKTVGEGGTDYHRAFGQLDTKLAAAAADPNVIQPSKRYVVILTDGVASNVVWTSPTWHVWQGSDDWTRFSPAINWTGNPDVFIQGFDPGVCNTIKSMADTQVSFMELEYLPLQPAGGVPGVWDLFIESNVRPNVTTNAQNCVSHPSKVYKANDPAEVQRGIDEIVEDVLSELGLRLTQ